MITIVTDSTSYFTKNEAKALGVRMVPLTYTVSSHLFNENFVDQNGNFERLISKYPTRCTTSQASITAFMSVFEELMRKGDDVFCITMSSRLSGTYSSASIAAKEVNKERIIVVDSLTVAGGLNLLIKYVRKLASRGYSLNELASLVEEKRNDVGILFSVDSMDALRRSGRLGIVRQSVGTILNIKPILMCKDGMIVSHGTARGRGEQVRKLVEMLPDDIKRVYIQQMSTKVNIEGMILGIKKRFPQVEIMRSGIGPVIGIHLGPGAVGISWIS